MHTVPSNANDPLHSVRAARGFVSARSLKGWRLDTLRGRLVEVCGSAATASLTAVARVILEAQALGGLAAWVGERRTVFYPPDFAACGIDLDAMPVVRADAMEVRLKALDVLMRSGCFDLIVLDAGHGNIPTGIQSRLAGLAKRHHTALVVLASNQVRAGAAGNVLASLRCETHKERILADRFDCRIDATKDKRHAPGWSCHDTGQAPDGLC